MEPAGMGLTVEHHGSSRASDEALDVMQHLWDYRNGDPAYEFETERYRGTIVKRPVPAPYRKHHPHVIVTGSRPAALERAARNGWPIFFGTWEQGNDAAFLAQLAAYRGALASAGHPQDVIDECMLWSCYDVHAITVADTDEAAELNAQEARAERNAMRDVFTARNARLADAIPVAEELGPRNPAPGGGRPRGGGGTGLTGNPDTVARRIQQLSDWGISHLLLRFAGEWSGATRMIAEKSMRLFNEEVMPRFKDVPPLRDPLAVDLTPRGEVGSLAAPR
jgi:alkanesulfonate monooxygenase SsuD/methylene tetrahydromethanopterin reductase-like flavin-dependent oxidoreductase (luciferase family)